MKAAVLKAFGAPLVYEDAPEPMVGPDEALIRVVACGIDGTDLKLLDGFGYTPDLPFIMGHEIAGVVESVADDHAGVRPGDRVVAYNFLIPRESLWFETEREQIAPDMTGVVGVKGRNGGYAERIALPAHQLVRIPEGVAFHDAAVHCDAGLTAWHAVRRSRLAAGETVLVIGAGGVGSFAIQYARLAGASVIVAERTVAKIDWARKLGADEAIADGIADAVRARTGDRGADCVIDIVGTEATMAIAIDAVAAGGRIVVVGYTPDSFTLSGKRLAQNEIEIIGSRAGSRRELAAALGLAAAGRVHSIVSERFPLSAVNEALARLKSGNALGRIVLDVDRSDRPLENA